MTEDACRDCLRRAWLVGAIGGHLERAHRDPGRLLQALALDDRLLLAIAVSQRGPALDDGYARFSAEEARDRSRSAGLDLVCQHSAAYPVRLKDLDSAPRVLHTVGRRPQVIRALSGPTAAVVGSRQPSPYGSDMARALARGLGAAGVAVVSGLALGIDAAAHAGALAAGATTIAVLAGGADVPYPARHRALYEHVARTGVVVSEMPAGYRAFRWSFLARNRIIAALSDAVIVVEGSETSGSLLTAGLASDLGRRVGAVPGRVTSRMAAGPLALLRDGAEVVRDVDDALELACGERPARSATAARSRGADLAPALRRLLYAISDGTDTAQSLVLAGHPPQQVTRGLGELELLGHVRRTLDGSYTVVP